MSTLHSILLKKSKMKYIIKFVLLSVILFSCSTGKQSTTSKFEKRKHRKGWYVHGSSQQEKLYKVDENVKIAAKRKQTNTDETFQLEESSLLMEDKVVLRQEIVKEIKGLNPVSSFLLKRAFKKVSKINDMGVEGCDIIILNNGEEIEAKILEVGISEVRFKKCSYQDGPTIVQAKSQIFMIKYADGTKSMMSSEKTNQNKKEESSGVLDDFVDDEGDGRGVAIALWFLFLIGICGVHRMYLGHWVVGILQFLTLGFCGIGIIVDIILLLTGKLKRK